MPPNLSDMERTAWTDERIDDLVERLTESLDRLDKDMREIRTTLYGVAAAIILAVVGSAAFLS